MKNKSGDDAVALSDACRYEYSRTAAPTILTGFEGEKCDKCEPCCCEKYLCCKRVVPRKYSVRAGQALMVVYNSDIYGQVVGPGEIKVCCDRLKEFFWIDTGVQTIEINNPSFYDFNQAQQAANAVITYRIVDIVNYVFNMKRTGGSQAMKLDLFRSLKCCEAMKWCMIKTFCPCIWNCLEKERTIKKAVTADEVDAARLDKTVLAVLTSQGKAAIQEVLGGEDPNAVKQHSRQMLTTALNRRIKHTGVVVYDVSMTEAGFATEKLKMYGEGGGFYVVGEPEAKSLLGGLFSSKNDDEDAAVDDDDDEDSGYAARRNALRVKKLIWIAIAAMTAVGSTVGAIVGATSGGGGGYGYDYGWDDYNYCDWNWCAPVYEVY